MGSVVVDVMLKPEILDPQGQAVAGALPRLGFDQFTDVRQGKRFVLDRRRRGHRRGARRGPRGGRDAAVQPRDRGRRLGAPGRSAHAVRIGVVTFPGSLDDRDAARAVRIAGGAEAVAALARRRRPARASTRSSCPGGFSYGDYLRCGAIARFAPVMDALVPAARGGLPVLGICNGFQVLCESAPAARRADPQRPPQVQLRRPAARVENASTAWTSDYERRPGDHHRPQERRGRLRRRRADARRARGRGPGGRSATSATTPTAPTAPSPASPTTAATSSA